MQIIDEVVLQRVCLSKKTERYLKNNQILVSIQLLSYVGEINLNRNDTEDKSYKRCNFHGNEVYCYVRFRH